MLPGPAFVLAVLSAFCLLAIEACSSQDDASGRRCAAPSGTCAVGGGSGTTAGSQGGNVGAAGAAGGVASDDNALRVRVEDPAGLTIEIITLECSGDCAEIEAVAHGGNPPYAYAWEDGSTGATRHVCLDASDSLSVTATDTATVGDEFAHAAQTVSAEVTATVLDCPGIPHGDLCVENLSFDGRPGISEHIGFFAPPWMQCMPSPDIINTGFNSNQVAADGSTFLRMVAANDAIRETVSQTLCAPLHAGTRYYLTLQLAAGIGAAALEIWGGSSLCEQTELLWLSPGVETETWSTHCVKLTPSQDITSLTLVPRWVGGATSAIHVDDIVPVDRCQ